MKMIDLRSDTVTVPSPEMRQAMCHAKIGDDGYGEDPTVNRLEEIVADRVGKEAALLVPSGIMANLVALLTFCDRGGEVILGYSTDMYLWETGGMSALGGIHPHPLPNRPDGTIELANIESAIRDKDPHFPPTQLICLENTNMLAGGVPLTPSYTAAVRLIAHRHGLSVYLDGARIFNSAVASGVNVKELTKDVDALMFCLSKGLSCPVGSMLCGGESFIVEARRVRKMLGGQMRQAGILAAAGIVALEQMVDRLAEDHINASILAQGLREVKGLSIKPDHVQTNIVYFKYTDDQILTEAFMERLGDEGLMVLPVGDWLRAVVHYGIDEEDIMHALSIIRRVA